MKFFGFKQSVSFTTEIPTEGRVSTRPPRQRTYPHLPQLPRTLEEQNDTEEASQVWNIYTQYSM